LDGLAPISALPGKGAKFFFINIFLRQQTRWGQECRHRALDASVSGIALARLQRRCRYVLIIQVRAGIEAVARVAKPSSHGSSAPAILLAALGLLSFAGSLQIIRIGPPADRYPAFSPPFQIFLAARRVFGRRRAKHADDIGWRG